MCVSVQGDQYDYAHSFTPTNCDIDESVTKDIWVCNYDPMFIC